VLHFLTDLLLRIDALPGWAHWTVMVGGDTLLLLYGLLLLRRPGRGVADPEETALPRTGAPAAGSGDHTTGPAALVAGT
jgi:hypothetical protein